MEILFDGIWIGVAGKSGIYSVIHIHGVILQLVVWGLAIVVVKFLSHQFKEHENAVLDWIVLILAVGSIAFILIFPIFSLICSNPISCDAHPRSDDSETWLFTPDELFRRGFEMENLNGGR